MVPRDAEATRQRLIEAASAEFAEYGIAGARVDRIAANALANKAQIYHYFGSKDRLFDAVWEAMVEQIADAAPVNVFDLPGFAAGLSQTYVEHPHLARLVTWQRLERGGDAPDAFAVESIQRNIDAIAKAQVDGLVGDRFESAVLFALIIHIAAVWGFSSPDVLAVVNVTNDTQRCEIVRSSVAALLN